MNAPIPALTPVRAIEAWFTQAGVREAQIGELLRLRVALTAEGGLLGESDDGLRVGLPPGLGRPGDQLLLRVLAREPRLQLQLLQRDVPPAAEPGEPPGGDWGLRALRPDQGRLLRWQLDQAARLPADVAAQWRAQALAEPGRVVSPGAAALPPGADAAWLAQAAPVQLVGWLGQVLWLRLLNPLSGFWPALATQPDARRDKERQQGRQQDARLTSSGGSEEGVCLCLNLDTAEGWVLVLLQWQQGLLMHVCAERAEALPWLRARLPAVAQVLAAVPLRLRHCSLGLRPPPLPEGEPSQRPQALASAVSQPLFRAAAEVARLLQI